MPNSEPSKEQKQEELGSNTQFQQAFDDITNQLFKQGMLPKEAVGINNHVLENIYAQAYRLYNTGKYVEATHLFRILIMLNAVEPKYMLGLAACFHMLKEYNHAIQSYTMCSALDPKNPIPHYHTSDCYIQMQDYLSAMICLELAIDRAGDKTEYAKMKERALLTLESLKKQTSPSEQINLSSEQEKPERSS